MEEEGFPKWERYIRVRDNGIVYYNICWVQMFSNIVLLYQGCPVLLLEGHFTAEFSLEDFGDPKDPKDFRCV